jgi:hypothetical protein
LVSGRGVITRKPHREQKAAFASASNPHWGHLIADSFPALGEVVRGENSRDYGEASPYGQLRQRGLVRRSFAVADAFAECAATIARRIERASTMEHRRILDRSREESTDRRRH